MKQIVMNVVQINLKIETKKFSNNRLYKWKRVLDKKTTIKWMKKF